VADAQFEIPRLAGVYDLIEAHRSDLDVYDALTDELGATSIIDIGCGTGEFACMLARRGLEVTGLDPAAASLAIARRKSGAERVRWVHGELDSLPSSQVDLATMTGSVAQVFVTELEWERAIAKVYASLLPGGHFVFESRVPDDRGWLRWTRRDTYAEVETVDGGTLQYWVETTDVRPGIVSFRSTYVFGSDGSTLTSDSTLRFRSRDELARSLAAVGFEVREVRDAPDRPRREFVFVAQRRLA
jgi:ubiquinone/menaquinone biosynthesis C-methylase UbiE